MVKLSELIVSFIAMAIMTWPVGLTVADDAPEKEILDAVESFGLNLDELHGVEFQFHLRDPSYLESCLGELVKLGVRPQILLAGDGDEIYLTVRFASDIGLAFAEIPDVLNELTGWAQFCGGSLAGWQIQLGDP